MTTSPSEPIDAFRGDRGYLGADHARNERRTWLVVAISVVTLVGQIVGGLAFHSMALIAGGLHMGAHVVALGAAAGAYAVARAYAADPRFTFGAGKVGYLTAFGNGVVLGITAILIALESAQRLLSPTAVAYDGALELAAVALAVNLVCVWLLKPARRHDYDADGDLNLSAAHLHLAADAAVSALAILSLAAGRFWNWAWADPVAALAGAGLVAHFSWRLISRAGAVLLDLNPSPQLTAEIRRRLEATGAKVLDLHLWRLGPGHHAAIAVLNQHPPAPSDHYHAQLGNLTGLSHVTIEVRDHP